MENFLNWFTVLAKALHFPFIAAIQINVKKGKKEDLSDIGNIGDNVPYVFVKW